jgi:hypothetical protein
VFSQSAPDLVSREPPRNPGVLGMIFEHGVGNRNLNGPVTGALINPATRSSFPDFVAWAELGPQRLGRTRWVNISQMSYDKFFAEVIKRAKFSSKIHESPTSGHNDVEVGYGRIPQQLLRSSDACAIGDGIRRGMADAQVDRH